MKKLLIVFLLAMTVLGGLEVFAEEGKGNSQGCELIFNENGEIINLEEYEACLSQLVEPCSGGNGSRGPRG